MLHLAQSRRPATVVSGLVLAVGLLVAGTGLAAPDAASTPQATTGDAQAGQAKPASFPDSWFFYGDKRPAELRALEGKPAPKISAETWVGEAAKIADLKGKVVIVDFWGTWCPPCRKAIPKNIELVKKYAASAEPEVAFIAIHDARRGWDKAPQMIKDTGINYPVALDAKNAEGGGISTKDFGVKFWPTYVAIDRTGTIRAVGLRPDKVEDVIKALVAEPRPVAG